MDAGLNAQMAADVERDFVDGRVPPDRATIRVVRDYVANEARDVFAGDYVEWCRGGGIVHVGFARDASKHLSELRRRAGPEARIDVFEATSSQLELEALRDRVHADWDDLKRLGVPITTLSTSPKDNTVEVGLADPSERAKQILRQRYGDKVHMREKPARFRLL